MLHPKRLFDQMVGRARSTVTDRRDRALQRAIAERKLREHQDPSIWRSGKGGAHHGS